MRFSLPLALLVGFVFAPFAAAQDTGYDWAGDHYPKSDIVDVVNYVFEINIEDGSNEIAAATTVDARFAAAGESTLRLDLVKRSDALEGKGMTVDQVVMDGQSLSFEHDGDQLFINLGREIGAMERIQVAVRYHGIPAAGLVIGPTKYGDFSVFSDNWSSKARNWLATVDHPYDKAMSEFIVTAPSRMQVVSNGLLIEETDLEGGLRRSHWKNSVPIATWLFALGAAEFAVQHVDTFEGKAIQTWVYRQDRDAGFYDFAVPSKQTLAFYSDLIGPYSYEKLANVQTNSVGGGMEAASSVFYSDRSVSGNRDRRWQHVIIHEIAHQWFGNAVTEHDWNHVWLSEGFATYYTLLFREYAYGLDDFRAGLVDARNRVIAFYENDYDFQLIRDDLADLDDVSGGMMYQKGAWTLHMLREMLGADVYHAGVRTYYHEFKDKTALTGDFRRHMEEASGIDLSGFFGQWLYQGGIPALKGSWTSGGGELSIELAQVQESYGFDLDVEIEVQFTDGSSERVTMESGFDAPASFSGSFEKEISEVVIDPDVRLLAKWEFDRK